MRGNSLNVFGLAFDIGTTTLAASLVDLRSGERISSAGALNPQRTFGSDIVTRLEAACSAPEMVAHLSLLVNGELERLANDLLRKTPPGGAVGKVAFAGNPAMEHLLLGLPVDSLARIPYRPLFSRVRNFGTKEIGWNLAAEALAFPLPGGFVGGDLLAFIVAAGVDNTCPRLYLDLGTNGEIALSTEGCISATSVAAGPAFEGGNIKCGMAAVRGAISRAVVSADRVSVETIGGGPPEGVCGSAVIEAVAGLRRWGVIDATGRLLSPSEISSNLAVRVREVDGERAFILHHDAERLIYLTQEDIRQVQLAKSAVRAGMEVLAEKGGISLEDVGEVVVTGSFGSHLLPEHLEEIGIFSRGMAGRARFFDDGALAGVERVLCDPFGVDRLERLAAACRVVPLSGNPMFERQFLSRMDFP
ncbi:ASKHA domain-containing protein [Geobacter sp. DSM 9736]|uniref:ASKHA domain-containing protein n=1 Tax=Geobacter sp. DSM 9736 TaxID=1277350 RepID=UPI000B613C3A|nr:ASKHA domain-containing protein [Geobacter sp. DSM 9736]SNB46651.1 protein of unknown function [Geobacter sp. DSM 9736]